MRQHLWTETKIGGAWAWPQVENAEFSPLQCSVDCCEAVQDVETALCALACSETVQSGQSFTSIRNQVSNSIT